MQAANRQQTCLDQQETQGNKAAILSHHCSCSLLTCRVGLPASCIMWFEFMMLLADLEVHTLADTRGKWQHSQAR